jgi:hypothetical protein
MRQHNPKTNKAQTETEIVKTLAVKATEENSSKLLSHMAVSSANISAIGAKSDEEFISKRASYLFKLLPSSVKLVAGVNKFPGNWIRVSILVSFVVGLLSNYLGPSKLIHVVYNPLTILLVWNILVYLFMILGAIWKIRLPKTEKISKVSVPDLDTDDDDDEKKKKKKSSNFLLDWVIGGIWNGIVQLKARFVDDSTKVAVLKKIIPAFWISYKEVAGRTLVFRFKSLMNVSAVGLLIGALAGVYFRGLFFKYNIIWQSTFVSDPETIRTMLNVLFGPASFIMQGHWVSQEMVRLLLSPDGTLAGPWIHMMALTTVFFILVPRSILAIYYALRSRKSIKNIDLNEPYFSDHILKNRESLVDVIRDGIREIISKKINRIGTTISDFVINDYYEKIIAPILVSFREKGGKLRKLENELLESQQKFEPILLNYLEEVQEDFRDTILTEINLFLGRKLDIDINTISTYQPQSDEIDQRLPGRIAEDIGDTIGGTIVTTVALAAGTVSGGIGKSLGIAIISGLLGVSGPLGLLIGGVATAITLGGFYQLKRDQISGMIKDVPLPSFVIAATLSDAKIERARKDTYAHTEKEIIKMLEPKIDEVTNGILKDLTY